MVVTRVRKAARSRTETPLRADLIARGFAPEKLSIMPNGVDLDLVDLGDFLEVSGPLFRTRTGEVTVAVEAWRVITKAIRPMPDAWHGLADVETRYRQRYLDLVVNPDSRRVFDVRSRLVSAIRTFMTRRGYVEVETPMMQPIAGGALAGARRVCPPLRAEGRTAQRAPSRSGTRSRERRSKMMRLMTSPYRAISVPVGLREHGASQRVGRDALLPGLPESPPASRNTARI